MRDYQIQRVDVAQIIDLRHRILRQGLPRESAMFDGDNGNGAVHLAAIRNGLIIGCATVLKNQWDGKPACQLRGMAVDLEFQMHGIGSGLLVAVDEAARESKVEILWCNARKPAVPFYEKHEWVTAGDEFEIPTAGPHFKMIKRLTA